MKLSVESKIWKTFAMGLSFAALSGCGEYHSTATPAARQTSPVVEEMTSYRATLQGIQTTSTNITGNASMKRTGDQLQIMITMNGVSDSAHRQTVRSGRCPVATDDTDGDGSISAEEAQAVLGSTVLELSNNLSTSAAAPATETPMMEEAATDDTTAGEEDSDSVGTTEFSEAEGEGAAETSTSETTTTEEASAVAGNFPVGSAGTYTYNQTADWSEIGVVSGGELTLPGKIVVIEGDDVSDSTPVACGTIEQEQADDDQDQMPQDGDQVQDQGQQDQGQWNSGQQQQQRQHQQQQQQQRQHQTQQQDQSQHHTEIKPVEDDTETVETESNQTTTTIDNQNTAETQI